jgi:hypothetical protein
MYTSNQHVVAMTPEGLPLHSISIAMLPVLNHQSLSVLTSILVLSLSKIDANASLFPDHTLSLGQIFYYMSMCFTPIISYFKFAC